MDKLVSNRAQTEIGQHAQDILQALFISSWQSEPHQQQQNPAERKYQMLKRYTKTILVLPVHLQTLGSFVYYMFASC